MHDKWTQREGLPHNVVETVLAARTGYLWFGTQEGLVRFDGARFTLFDRSNTPGLAGDEVYALGEDAAGDLWIGTTTGLSRLRGRNFELVPTGGSPLEAVHHLVRDGDDLWAATDSGLRRLHGGAWSSFGAPDGLVEERATALAPARGGGLWVGGQHGLSRWAEGRLSAVAGTGLPAESVTALLEGEDGVLWVGTTRGLARRPAGAPAFSAVAAVGECEVRALALDQTHALWVATSAGVLRVRGDEVETAPGERENVNALYLDGEGSLWFGTATDGLHRLHPGTVLTISKEEGLSSLGVWAVAPSADGSILAAGDGGVDRIGAEGPRPLRPDLTRREGMTALLEDRSGDLWIGTDAHGVLRTGAHGTRWYGVAEGFESQPRVIFEDAAQAIWVGARDGLYLLRGERLTLAASSRGAVSDVEQGPDARLYLGTTAGLFRLEGDRLAPVPVRGLLGALDVTALHFDADGSLWVGTAGAGLWLLRGGRGWNFTRRQGLPEDQVFAIVDDGLGYLWLSGNHGITRLARAELEAVAAGRASAVAPTALGRADGMKEVECSGGVQPSGARGPDGRLWFPTIRGVVVVNPKAVTRNPEPPRAFVEDIVVDGTRSPPEDGLSLAPGHHRLEVHYTAAVLAHADRIRFRYRLRGFDAGFIDAGGERVAHYAGLGPGRYLFELSAANESGVWGEKLASFAFEIEPRFWQTRWFKLLLALAVVALVLAALETSTRRLRAERRELVARVREESAKVKALSGLVPICAWCRRIEVRPGGWQPLEQFISESAQADITHGMCPDCYARHGEQG